MNRTRLHLAVAAACTLSFAPVGAGASASTATPPAPAPTATAVAASSCADGGGVWVAYFGSGVSCVEGGGWQSFGAADKSLASDQVNDVVVCGGRVVVAHTFGISTRSKGRWRTDRLKAAVEAVACDAAGNIWAGHYDGVSVFDGKAFRTIDARRLGSGSGARVVQDVAVGPDGKVWVTTANSVAMYDGARWRVWEQGAGFEQREFFGRVAVNSRGAPWVTAVGGVYTFDDGKWWLLEVPGAVNLTNVAVDGKDRVFVATTGAGLYIYEDAAWTNLRRENSELSSDDVRAAAVDSRGRLWIATAYGLDVVEDEQWRHYRVNNSGLRDDAVHGAGGVGRGRRAAGVRHRGDRRAERARDQRRRSAGGRGRRVVRRVRRHEFSRREPVRRSAVLRGGPDGRRWALRIHRTAGRQLLRGVPGAGRRLAAPDGRGRLCPRTHQRGERSDGRRRADRSGEGEGWLTRRCDLLVFALV